MALLKEDLGLAMMTLKDSAPGKMLFCATTGTMGCALQQNSVLGVKHAVVPIYITVEQLFSHQIVNQAFDLVGVNAQGPGGIVNVNLALILDHDEQLFLFLDSR
jgi:hypothetical protein